MVSLIKRRHHLGQATEKEKEKDGSENHHYGEIYKNKVLEIK